MPLCVSTCINIISLSLFVNNFYNVVSSNDFQHSSNDCSAIVGYNVTLILQEPSPMTTCISGYQTIYSDGSVVWYPDNTTSYSNLTGYYNITSSNSINNQCYMEIKWDTQLYQCLTWSPTKNLRGFIGCSSYSHETYPECIVECTGDTVQESGWIAVTVTSKLQEESR